MVLVAGETLVHHIMAIAGAVAAEGIEARRLAHLLAAIVAQDAGAAQVVAVVASLG